MKKRSSIIALIIFTFIFSVASVSAHVSVKPNEVGVGSFQTFTVGVPNERDVPSTKVRLQIPEGLGHVMPLVKQGWNVEVVQGETAMESHEGDTHEEMGQVTEIVWSGGSVPVGMKEEFSFSAQVPAETTNLRWNAYQTYADGTVVSWEVGEGEEQPTTESGEPDFSEKGPASYTQVVDDLTSIESQIQTSSFDPAYVLSILALFLSGAALYMTIQKKK